MFNPQQFQAFFRELHGYDPYPWQTRLCGQVLKSGWPDFIKLPTGSGKTSVLDIAVFALAAQTDLPRAEQTAATRIFFVIDRRIVVDEADRQARALASELSNSLLSDEKLALRDVAEKLMLRAVSDGRRGKIVPLETHTLRGGFYRTNDWAGSLVQPMIVTSTVDQVGSRILFRGYGISPGARPLQAALVGSDSLIILDEAHTAMPMGETVTMVRNYQQRAALVSPVKIRPISVVQMTATLPKINAVVSASRSTFELNADEDFADQSSPLDRRYRTKKPIQLDVAKAAKGNAATSKLAKDLFNRVQDQLKNGRESIAIVVNRIATARELHGLIAKSKKLDVDLHLMIGRMRPDAAVRPRSNGNSVAGVVGDRFGSCETKANRRGGDAMSGSWCRSRF